MYVYIYIYHIYIRVALYRMHAAEHPDYAHATTLEGITVRTQQVSVYLSISLHLSIVIEIHLVYICTET